jgi:hypothetical protein
MAPKHGGPSDRRVPLVLAISLPGYTIDAKPDYALGRRVDRILRARFDVDRILIRALSSSDHPRFSLDQLAREILERGTDKHDPERKGVSHSEFEPYRPDLQAAPFEVVAPDDSVFGGIMRHFYEHAPLDRGYPLRIDLLVIYDQGQLMPAKKADSEQRGTEPRLERYLLRFRNPGRKQDALLGLVKILPATVSRPRRRTRVPS